MTTCNSLLAGNLYGLMLVVLALVYAIARVVGFFLPRKSPPAGQPQRPLVVRIGEGLVLACAFVVVGVALASCIR